MAIKRKRTPDSLPDSFVMEPSSRDSARQTQPIAAYLATGFRPDQNQKTCTWQVYQNPQKHQLVVGRANEVDFVGRAQAGAQTGPALCRYALGVMDKGTGMLKYSEISGNTIMRIEPRSHKMVEADEIEDSVVDHSPAGKMLAHNRLINLFGSQRAKRQLSAAQAAAVTPETMGDPAIIQAYMQQAAAKAGGNLETREVIMAQLNANRNIPPHHQSASKPADAYRLDEVIPADLAAVVDISSLHKAATDKEYLQEKGTKWVPQLILDRLPRLPRAAEGTSSEERDRSLLALSVAGAILHLLSQPPRLVASMKPHEVSAIPFLGRRVGVKEELLQALLDKFYDNTPEYPLEGGRKEVFSQASAQRTLMTMHALVLLLMFDKFTFGPGEFDKLRRHLKMQASQLVKLFRELGCNTKAVGKPAIPAEQQHQNIDHAVIAPASNRRVSRVLCSPSTPLPSLRLSHQWRLSAFECAPERPEPLAVVNLILEQVRLPESAITRFSRCWRSSNRSWGTQTAAGPWHGGTGSGPTALSDDLKHPFSDALAIEAAASHASFALDWGRRSSSAQHDDWRASPVSSPLPNHHMHQEGGSADGSARASATSWGYHREDDSEVAEHMPDIVSPDSRLASYDGSTSRWQPHVSLPSEVEDAFNRAWSSLDGMIMQLEMLQSAESSRRSTIDSVDSGKLHHGLSSQVQEQQHPEGTDQNVPGKLDEHSRRALAAAVERCRMCVWLWAWRSAAATALMQRSVVRTPAADAQRATTPVQGPLLHAWVLHMAQWRGNSQGREPERALLLWCLAAQQHLLMLQALQEPSWRDDNSATLDKRMAELTQMLLQGADDLGQGDWSDAHYAGMQHLNPGRAH
ncbi:hypothetical protein WJX73_005549 [Symbiochloris irregularis]|uniref:Uncharacterized protein n=1 Tax=Symbiochloris irregularis TaxID=706552 RepID=A0AAW1PRZ4_9CHLO